MSDRMELARAAWGDVPDWIAALVRACDARGSSQNKVAQRLGYTGAVVSQVIRRRYPARLAVIEDRVRAIYLGGDVGCPALGFIGSESCLQWRDRSRALTSANPAVVRMFRACAVCPRNRAAVEEDAD